MCYLEYLFHTNIDIYFHIQMSLAPQILIDVSFFKLMTNDNDSNLSMHPSYTCRLVELYVRICHTFIEFFF